jgi:hypothetical protein
MRQTVAAVLSLALAVPAAAGLFWRDKLVSRWTAKPLAVDADDTDWNAASAYEQEGLSIQAMNDGTDLYLLVTGHTRETRDIVVGEAKQDMTLWFLASDGKTREWGARLPFSRRESLATVLRDPTGLDPVPELVRWNGTAVSSETWPSELIDRLAAAGRRPVWELKVPLKRVSLTPEHEGNLDLSVSAPASAARRQKPAEEPGGESRGRRHEKGGGAGSPTYDPPGAMTLLMTLRLAVPPPKP